MHRMRASTLAESRLGLVAFLTTVLPLPLGNASAKDRKTKQSANEAHIVAQLSFSGFSAVDMAVHKANDKYTSMSSTRKARASRLLTSASLLKRKLLE